MPLPGIGFTSASCNAYCIQNGVRLPGLVSPGSSQAGGIVTYTANLISPSGLVCAAAEPGPPKIAATASTAAEASFCHPFINPGFPACAGTSNSHLLLASPASDTCRSGGLSAAAHRSGRHYGRFSCTSSSGADHGNGSIFINAASATRFPTPLGQK